MPKRKATPAIPTQMQPVIDYMVKRYQEEGKAFDYQQFFSQIIGGFIQNVMNAELENTLGYSKYDRVEKEKPNARNGSSPKTVKSSYGEINLAVPRDRSGEYSPWLSYLKAYLTSLASRTRSSLCTDSVLVTGAFQSRWKSSTVLHCPHQPSLRSPIVFCQTSAPGKTALCSACTPIFSSMRLTSTSVKTVAM